MRIVAVRSSLIGCFAKLPARDCSATSLVSPATSACSRVARSKGLAPWLPSTLAVSRNAVRSPAAVTARSLIVSPGCAKSSAAILASRLSLPRTSVARPVTEAAASVPKEPPIRFAFMSARAFCLPSAASSARARSMAPWSSWPMKGAKAPRSPIRPFIRPFASCVLRLRLASPSSRVPGAVRERLRMPSFWPSRA